MFKLSFLPVLGGTVGYWIGDMIARALKFNITLNILFSTVIACLGVYIGYKLYQQLS